MAENNNDKKKIWIYAIVLFTSAFIVLLLTAVSQIKLNKNISDYKTQIYTKEKEKSDFKLNLNSSLNENKKLQDELEDLKAQINEGLQDKKSEEKKYNELEDKLNKVVNAYERLIQAENEYDNENYVESALILNKQCESKYLDEQAVKKYNYLRMLTYQKASKELYTDGLKDYKNGNYVNAVEKFQISVDLTPDEYYSDDCYYYIAYSLYKNGKYDDSKKAINTLLKGYPSSSYIKDVYDLLKLMNQ